jgi:riboflavin transporter FmnP
MAEHENKSLLKKRKKYLIALEESRSVLALVCGTLAMAAVMIPANLFITPIFMGAPRAAVAAMLPTAIIPFNLLKAGINSIVTFLLYKRVSPLLHK